MNNRHPWPLKKSKSWGPFWSYQLNSTANSAYPPRKWAKWAELAVMFSRQPQNRPRNFDFFQWPWMPIIHFSLFSMRPVPPNLMDLINHFQAVCALSCTAGKHSCTYVLRDWMPVCIELTLDLHFKRGFFVSRCTYLEYSQQQEKKYATTFKLI